MSRVRPTEENIAKLPKWAQRKINKLEQDVIDYKEQARQVKEKDTNTFLTTGLSEDDIGLPKNSTIKFITSNQGEIEVKVEGSTVSVHSSETLYVTPESSNHVHIFTRDK